MLFRSNDTATTEIYTVRNTFSLHDALPIHGAMRVELLGLVHDPHAAFEDLPNDLVTELVLNREESHPPMVAKRVLKSSPTLR